MAASADCDIIQPSVLLDKTDKHIISNYVFGDLTEKECIEIWKDGRPFSHFIEGWLAKRYPIKHIKGCKKYDFIDEQNEDIKYDEKTFTKKGCKFCPSNMVGQGRKFDKDVFEEKCKEMIFCFVSNIDFPNILVRFVRGSDLMKSYPKGEIRFRDHDTFFNPPKSDSTDD